MNWQHLQTFIWLRWRLRSNQRKRAGTLTVMIQTILMVLAVGAAVVALIAGFIAGVFPLARVSAADLLIVWDVVVGLFLLMWTAELLAELQRSELLSLERFLHLPVSLKSLFLLNYLGSMVCLAGIIFFPAMIGLSLGLAVSRGWLMLLLLPLVGALALAITAVTYQFRGWLASLMVNQRRRRTIVAFASLAFMLVLQLPNLWNMSRTRANREANSQIRQEILELDRAFAAGTIARDEYALRSRELAKKTNGSLPDVQRYARTASVIVPFGWLPYGAMSLAGANIVPALLGALGLALIGAASLSRSYQTTLRLYTGDFNAKRLRQSSPVAGPVPKDSTAFIEQRIPWISEQASVIALCGFRSLMRAPESKMMLLSPVIVAVVFGSMFMRANANPAEFLRPVVAAGGITMLFFTMMSLAGNQFGFDRGGFRVFVLSCASRKDILLGKNLSLSPILLGLALLVTGLIQFAYPMRIDHLLAVFIQLVPMFLMFSLISNFLSILAPMPIRPGSLKPASPKGKAILIHLGFLVLFPLVMSTTLIPLGIEFLLSWSGTVSWFPAYLALTLVEAAIVLKLYPQVLTWQGELLQRREQRILETVTSRIE